MSQHRPHLGEILRTVRELLGELAPQVDAKGKYDLRVGVYLLEMAEREVALGTALSAKQRAQLGTLLGREPSDPVSVAELETELARRLRAGELDDRLDEVTALVLEQTVDSVRVVKPSQLDSFHKQSADPREQNR